ncbi:MAG: tetratricopeptide repeat protein [Saprospiraceae bacterium]|nr:tetratricopeptide repeat protein [Saprospiraceae bacterium]
MSAADPQAARYTFRLASCYQALGRLKDAREMIQLLRDGEHYSPATLDVMEGGLLLGERQPLQAIKMYKRAEKNVDKHLAKINLQIAQAYILLKRWDDALVSINKELKIDNENPDAHFTKGEILLRQQNYEDASNSFLTAIGLDFHQPTYHHFLGESLYHFGEYNAATKAFESSIAIFPDNNKAKQRLIHLYRSHLNREADAAKLEAEIDTSLKGTIYVVSGLPRSGTSLMMQMLEKGGMDIFTDQVRESDENNPKGYYEHEAVKNLAKNKKWVPDAKDKVVKVVAQLLHHLPPHYHYKIVFMERDLYEIIASQQKMLERLGKKEKSEIFPTEMLNNFEKTIDNVKKWLTLSQNVDIIFVKHKAIITDPFSIAIQLNEFLDYQLIPELMVSAVDTSLHREKK